MGLTKSVVFVCMSLVSASVPLPVSDGQASVVEHIKRLVFDMLHAI